jgi:glycosyltransferase involved in cell wall biosynthesis
VRIAVFCPEWGQVGGIERKAESLIAEFERRGHRVVVLARGNPAAVSSGATPLVVRVRMHTLPRRPLALARQLRFGLRFGPAVAALRRATIAHDVDVVLTLAVSAFAPYAIAFSRTRPLVLSLEGRETGGVFTATPRVLRRALRRAARIVACSSSLATDARALAPEATERIVMIPNGVELERFATGPSFAHPRPYVLAVGRLARQKGFDVLLEAFARLDARAAGVDLLVAGEGPERPALEALRTRLGLGTRVQLLGALDSPTVAALYRGALFVACPSRWEGLPLVCLEAMASGRAVVAAGVDGVTDAVVHEETGLVVPSEDVPSLTAALATLLDDPGHRGRLAAGGSARAAGFRWSEVAERYLEVLAAAAR